MTNTTRAGDSAGRPEAVIKLGTRREPGIPTRTYEYQLTNAGVRGWAPVGGRSTPSRATPRTRPVGTRTGTERGEPDGPRRAGRARGGKAGPQHTVVVTKPRPISDADTITPPKERGQRGRSRHSGAEPPDRLGDRLVRHAELDGDQVIAAALGAQGGGSASKTLIRGCRKGAPKHLLQE